MPVKTLTEQVSCEWLRDAAATVHADEVIVEVGTYAGGSLRYLCEGATAGNGAKVYGVDQWGTPGTYPTRPHLARAYGLANMRLAAQAAPTATLIRQLSTEAAKHWTGGKIGLLYVDADHSYAAVQSDYQAWRPHLAPDAIVAFDDYWKGRFDGVIRFVDELVASGELTDFEKIGHHLAVTRYTISA